MSVYKIAVCDDNEIERDILCMMLRDYDSKQTVYSFSCGEDLLNSDITFDLVFMDIYMNGMTGMEVAREFLKKKTKTPIVFLTSSSDYAVESYEVHAFDYIVKPLKPKRLEMVWNRFISLHKKLPGYLVLNISGKTEIIPYEQIELLDSDCHYVTVHLTDGTERRINGKLDDFEKQLDDTRFLRCHKSFLINMNLTKAMDDDFLMFSGKQVAYRKREKKQLQTIFNNYVLGRICK